MYLSHLADVSVRDNTIRNYGTVSATAWVTGTTYYQNQVVSYSRSDYICTNTSSVGFVSTVAPSSDTTNWTYHGPVGSTAIVFVTCARARTGGNRVYDSVGENNYAAAVNSPTDVAGVSCADVLFGDDMFQGSINNFAAVNATDSRPMLMAGAAGIGNAPHRITFGANYPSDGTWSAGDICFNLGATSGGTTPLCWVYNGSAWKPTANLP
jgi:hypothetical protein